MFDPAPDAQDLLHKVETAIWPPEGTAFGRQEVQDALTNLYEALTNRICDLEKQNDDLEIEIEGLEEQIKEQDDE